MAKLKKEPARQAQVRIPVKLTPCSGKLTP